MQDTVIQPSHSIYGIEQAKQRLITLLNGEDEALRCYSARVVGQSQIVEAEAALNHCLYHSDPDVVTDAATALEQLKQGDVAALCDVAQHHPEGDARLAALNALSHHVCLHQVEALFIQLAQGRGSTDQWGISSDWDDWWDIQLKATQILVSHNKREYLDVYHAVLDQDPEPELEALLYQGIADLEPDWIVDKLINARLMVRRKLLRALIHSDAQVARAFLFKHLQDEDPLCRRISIEALAAKQATEYFWDIAQCLCDKESQVQSAAVKALEQLAVQSLDKGRLLSYLEKATPRAQAQLIELVAGHGLSEPDVAVIVGQISVFQPEGVIALLSGLDNLDLSDDLRQQVLLICIELLEQRTLESHHQIRLIHALSEVPWAIEPLFTHIEKRIDQVEDKTQRPVFDASIRQACFDLMSHQDLPMAVHLMRTTLFGLQAYPDHIEVQQTDAQPEEELQAVLAQHQVPQQLETDNRPVSTLSVIAQSNLEAKLGVTVENDDLQVSIVDMVEELDDEFIEFADVVKANFDSAEKLNLNRKKIARLPEFDNKILALRALGQSCHPQACEWLVESLLGATEEELREVFLSLARQKQCNPRSSVADNGIGAAAHCILSGDELTQQSALKYLALVPAAKAVPLAIEALRNANEHVRLSALFTVETHMNKLTLQLKPLVKTAIWGRLQDTSAGVRNQALKLISMLESHDDELEPLIELTLKDEECHQVAFRLLARSSVEVLSYLHLHFDQLPSSHKPNAIKLIGALL